MPSPVTSIGLYYPFIQFRNENWLKVAALELLWTERYFTGEQILG